MLRPPCWDDEADPLANSLADLGKKFWVDVFLSPKQILKVSPAAVQKAMVRELEDWDDPTDARPAYFSLPPASGCKSLCENRDACHKPFKAKATAQVRCRCDDTALELFYSLFESGIVKLKVEDILKPAVSAILTACRHTHENSSWTMVALLEARGDRGDFAQSWLPGDFE